MAFALLLFMLLLACGAPIVFALGISSVSILTLVMDVPIAIVAQRMYAGLDSFMIMAIPFFVFAGLVMDAGGISRRIVALAEALVGWITGSVLLVSVVASTGLAAISGSGSADTAAISSIMQPVVKKRRYDVDFAAAVIAAGGSLASIIPPSLLMVVIAAIANVSVGQLFLAGVIPGLLTAFALLALCYMFARRGGPQYLPTESFSFARLKKSFMEALPAIGMPAIVIGGLVGGVFTPTEAAAIAVLYGLIVGMFVYRELKVSRLIPLILRAVSVSASVMIILASAAIFSWLVSAAQIPATLHSFLTSISSSQWTFLLFVNLLLLVVGMFMESIAAILILVPMLMPIAISYGVDPVHFCLIVVFNLTIGLITPPYGIALYVASTVAGRSIMQVAKKITGPLLVMLFVLFLVTYVPSIGLALPQWLMNT